MEAEGKGIYEILSKQAEGYKQLVQAAGGDTKNAVTYLIAEKLPELVKTQDEAYVSQDRQDNGMGWQQCQRRKNHHSQFCVGINEFGSASQ